jgi:hypothetical protein
MVSDYTPNLESIKAAPSDKRVGVSYNATKAEYATSRLRRYLPEVDFVPIAGMSQSEVYETLKSTQIYLDLGAHPGKDRIPREAAIAGNVVVVGLRGAAAYSADIPIPFTHKVLMRKGYEISAARKLSAILESIPEEFANQESFRASIYQEKTIFDCEVRAFFVDGIQGFDSGHRLELAMPLDAEQIADL